MGKLNGIVGFILGGAAGSAGGYWYNNKNKEKAEQTIRDKDARINKFVGYFNILDMWMRLKEADKTIEPYLLQCGYNCVAIYGMGKMAEHFIHDLENSSVEIAYGIDKNISKGIGELEVYEIGEELPDVDAIIVTATFDFDNIKNQLREYVMCDIVSLEEVVFKSEI